MQDAGRVDLDLSAAFFDAGWNHVATCDFHSLRAGGTAAVHSGDFTDAPPPDGASEFIDLNLDLLRDIGARYAVATVLSYNNVAFEDMAEAFAGVMVRSDDTGPVFDARAVEQRFDLAGRARASVPFVVDLQARTLRWLDVTMGVTGSLHSVGRHHDTLGVLARALSGLYTSGARVGLGELAIWHAAARADSVVRRSPTGARTTFTRRTGEGVEVFADRIAAGLDDDARTNDAPSLAFLYYGDLRPTEGAQVYALHPRSLDANVVRLLAADELVSQLALPPRA